MTLGAPIAVALHARGWTLDAMPGRPVTLSKDGVAITPFVAIEEFAAGTMAPEAWREWCATTGLADTDFSALVPGR